MALFIVALDSVAYKDFIESKKLGFGVEAPLRSDPGPLVEEVVSLQRNVNKQLTVNNK